MAKCYIRNGTWAWPVDRQLKMLGDLWDEEVSFRDALNADRAKAPGRVKPDWLVERAAMLRPSGRQQDEVHVASLLVLAVSEADLVDVLAAAAGRNMAVVAHDIGQTIGPCRTVTCVASALHEWREAKLRARTEPGRLEGVRVAAEKRRAETLRKVKVARPLWRDTRPERLSTDQVASETGVSVKTLYAELGHRPKSKKGRRDAAE